MRKIRVNLGDRSYDILIGSGLLSQSGKLLKDRGLVGGLVIITNPVVQELHSNNLKNSLTAEGFEVNLITIADGENNKSLDTAGRLYTELADSYAMRTMPVLAFGGGVIGDLAGFVASTYMRGVPLVQIPTTLLAQVDSSIGGKVAVNHGKLKNAIGSFYQPRLVIVDTTTLKTLPSPQLNNGMAEVIKSAIIRDADFFCLIEKNIRPNIDDIDEDVLEEFVYRTAAIKADIVADDELDGGLRNILNFGHTVGHAIETASDFVISHGEAVAAGMIAEATIALKAGFFSEKEMARLKKVIIDAGLPAEIPKLDIDKIKAAMEHDKKITNGRVKFVLPKAIGDVFVSEDVSSTLVEKVLKN
jgi:3-dehydroquinate synthase